MLNPLVKEYLYSLNPREEQAKKDGLFTFDYPSNAYTTRHNRELMFIKNFFLKNNYVYISKHPRFVDYPEHGHDFFEFNYMLAGQCEQIINGKSILLAQGDLVLLNSRSRHEIKALSEKDILVNIIFPKEKFDIEWMSDLKSLSSPLFSFLMQDISDQSDRASIYFEGSKNKDVQVILQQMINKYFTDGVFANDILRFFIPILFMELVGNTPYQLDEKKSNPVTNETIIKSLGLIQEEYSSLTLTQLSRRLHYSKNYLSNLLSEKTSSTFTELLNEERLRRACLLLNSTSASIRNISDSVGISNLNYFYKLFEAKYRMTPKEYREQQLNNEIPT